MRRRSCRANDRRRAMSRVGAINSRPGRGGVELKGHAWVMVRSGGALAIKRCLVLWGSCKVRASSPCPPRLPNEIPTMCLLPGGKST
jgi:hypothetical protein